MLKAQNDNGNEQQYYTRTCHIKEMKTGIKWSVLQEWTTVFKNIKHVSQTFHEVEQTMQWFGLSLYSKSQWQKKVCQLVKSEADFLSTVTDVECLQPTVKLKFVAG